MLQIKEPN